MLLGPLIRSTQDLTCKPYNRPSRAPHIIKSFQVESKRQVQTTGINRTRGKSISQISDFPRALFISVNIPAKGWEALESAVGQLAFIRDEGVPVKKLTWFHIVNERHPYDDDPSHAMKSEMNNSKVVNTIRITSRK